VSFFKDLLYQNNSLVIPGFGNFVLTYASSTIDHVQGMLHPPSKNVEFDSNLITNDGKLLAHIQEKHQVSQQDASAVINAFVSNIKALLGKREMVVIPEVGKLYKDFEDNIQFIPDTTNFRKESFGLPSIAFYPIPKSKITTKNNSNKKPNTTSPQKATIPPIKKEKKFWQSLTANNWLPYLLGSILIALFGTCLVYPRLATNKNISPKEARVNQKPNKTDIEETEDPTEDLIDKETEEALAQEEEIIDTESITVNPNQKECIVSIGVFGVKENATKLIEQLFNESYDVYKESFDRNGKSFTKVGIQFAYETEEELNSTLARIKKDYPKAVLVKK